MRWILLVLTLAFSLSSHSGENKNEYARDTKHAPNPEQRGTDSNPITVTILPSQDAETNAAKEEEWRKEKAQEDRALTWATIVLAFLNGCVVLFNASLWWETRKLAVDSKKSADAAIKSAEIAERALADIERPYIFVSDAQWGLKSDGAQFVTYTIANHGKLPAIIQDVRAIISGTSSGTPDKPRSVDADDPLLLFPILAAGKERSKVEFIGSPNDIGSYIPSLEAKDDLYFWIVIFYRGPFTKGHESSCCWRLSVDGESFLKFIPFGQDKYNYIK